MIFSLTWVHCFLGLQYAIWCFLWSRTYLRELLIVKVRRVQFGEHFQFHLLISCFVFFQIEFRQQVLLDFYAEIVEVIDEHNSLHHWFLRCLLNEQLILFIWLCVTGLWHLPSWGILTERIQAETSSEFLWREFSMLVEHNSTGLVLSFEWAVNWCYSTLKLSFKLNGTFLLGVGLIRFSIGCFAYNINKCFLLVVHARR